MKKKSLNFECSSFSVGFILVAVVLSIFWFPSNNVLSWDVFGYYLYLPSFFIYNDLGLDNMGWINHIVETYNSTGTLYQFSQSPLGHNVIQYPIGMAILFSPFFLLGHIVSLFTEYPSDGFSLPYQIAFIFGNLFYLLLGLIYLRKVLRQFYSDKITAGVLLIIGIGTNYFHLNVWNTGMSHNYLFTLYALLLWFTIKWHEKKRGIDSIKLGLLMGLITLARPSEIICVLIPLFYGFKSFSERLSIIQLNYKKIGIVMFTMFLIGLPQLFYWKIFGGNFFYNSYRNQGEGLDFLSPHILEVLFSFRKGWFIYTPVMLFSVVGLYFLFRQNRKIFTPVILFFLINLFIVSSWTVWWYATSFSQRALMQSYAIMSIPMASFLTMIVRRNKIIKWGTFSLISLLVFFNLFQMWQMNQGIINGDRMTKDYYFSVFGQIESPTQKQKELLLIERLTTNGKELMKNKTDYHLVAHQKMSFEDDEGIASSLAHSGSKAFNMDSLNPFSPAIRINYKQLMNPGNDHAWVKANLWFYPLDDWKESKLSLIVTFEHGKGKNYKYKGLDAEKLENIIPHQWNKIEMEYLTPEVRSDKDNLVVYAWIRGKKNIIIDDLEVVSYSK